MYCFKNVPNSTSAVLRFLASGPWVTSEAVKGRILAVGFTEDRSGLAPAFLEAKRLAHEPPATGAAPALASSVTVTAHIFWTQKM